MLRSCVQRQLRSIKKPYTVYNPLLLSSQQCNASTSPKPCKEKGDEGKKDYQDDRLGKGFYYTIGAVVIGTGSVVVYANQDPEFRKWLGKNVPGSDEFISFVFAEERSYWESISGWGSQMAGSLYKQILGLIESSSQTLTGSLPVPEPPCDDEQKPYTPPKSAFQPLLDAKKPTDKFTEQRVAEQVPGKVAITPIESTIRKEPEGEGSTKVLNTLYQLENEIGKSSQEAIKAYNDAICSFRDYAEEIHRLIDQPAEKLDAYSLNLIKKHSDERERLLKVAEERTQHAKKDIKKLRDYLMEGKLQGETKSKTERNMDRMVQALEDAKKSFEQEKAISSAGVTDKYWAKVQEARKNFTEELQILFPDLSLNERKLNVSDGDLNLFVLYAFQKIIYYQKELSKMETILKDKIEKGLDKLKITDDDVIDLAVEAGLEMEKRNVNLEFQKKVLIMRAELEREMRLQMKRQAEAHADHLKDALDLKEKEMERRTKRQVEERLVQEETNFKMQIAGMVGRLRGMESAMQKRVSQDKETQQSQILWSACQTLEASLRSRSNIIPIEKVKLEPLGNVVKAITKAAAPGDELVATVVGSIPGEALARGVYPEAVLRQRFANVERVAQRVALLTDCHNSLPVILISYLVSFFTIPNTPIPKSELNNEPFDPSKLNNNDILNRARFWLDRGDIIQCLRYMNLLQGAAKQIASEWIKETRLFLEVKQAAHVLMAHAGASGLAHS